MFVCIATSRLICIAPLVDRNGAQVEQREMDDHSIGLMGFYTHTKSKVTFIWSEWSPFLFQRMERKGEEPAGSGGWRGLWKGWLQSGLANDNRCKFVSNRALRGCRLRHMYCSKGL